MSFRQYRLVTNPAQARRLDRRIADRRLAHRRRERRFAVSPETPNERRREERRRRD
ncbi:MAG TPA: hypothetical protein VJA66_11165 [Thermoanaerobaculia bacterium]